MKIAFITETFYPSTNGVVTRLTQSICWLVREGHEALVVAPDQGVSEVEGAQVIGVPSLRFFCTRTCRWRCRADASARRCRRSSRTLFMW